MAPVRCSTRASSSTEGLQSAPRTFSSNRDVLSTEGLHLDDSASEVSSAVAQSCFDTIDANPHFKRHLQGEHYETDAEHTAGLDSDRDSALALSVAHQKLK